MLVVGESWGAEDLQQTMAIAAARECRLVVVDADRGGADYVQRLCDVGGVVCALDDLAAYAFPCQLVVNGGVHARELPYRSSSGRTRFLLGPDYSILGEGFWDVPPRTIDEGLQNILVVLGGADPYRLMPDLLSVVDRLPGDFTITAVIGPFFENHVEVQAAAASAGHRVRLVDSPASLRELMVEADVAISAGGQTLYELARVGCPTIAIRTASNQDGQIAAFTEAGFIRPVGHVDDRAMLSNVDEALQSLTRDAQARTAMGAAGQRMVGGQGALRVAEALVTAIGQGT